MTHAGPQEPIVLHGQAPGELAEVTLTLGRRTRVQI